MANKFYNYRVRAVGVPQAGTGYLDFSDTTGYKSFSSVVDTANQERFVYRITAATETSKYEYGIGYLTDSAGYLRLTREKVYSSSQGSDAKVAWITADGSLTLDMMVPHPNYISNKRINSTSSLDNISTTYFVDATGNLVLTLPPIDATSDTVAINLMITSLSGSENERANALTLDADGTNTIDGTGTYVVSKKNDLITVVSDVENENWVILDRESDIASSDGPDGSVQIASAGAISSDSGLFYLNNALFIGGSGTSDASIQLTAADGATFNLQSGNMDFAVNSSGAANTLFVDGSANSVGIRTSSPADLLHVNTTGVGGVTIANTGIGGIPIVTLKNTDPNFTDGTDVGRIDFVGLDDGDNNTTYGRILVEAKDETDGSEEGRLNVYVNHNGTLQSVANLTYDDVQIGPNNSASGGVIVGTNNINEGDNVVLGYSNTNCGTSSISVGHSNTISSGSYGGAFGTNHSVTGTQMWLFGGSGFDVTGNNTTYLVGDSNNYVQIKHDQHQRVSVVVDTTGTDFNIQNTRISTSGVEHKQNFVFNSDAGASVTGGSFGVKVLDATDGSEDTRFIIKVLQNGAESQVLGVSANNVNLSNITGFDNSVLVGSNLSVTGTGAYTTIVGMSNTIASNSGTNTIIGYDNDLDTSGNNHTALVGNSNTIDENYTSTVGTSNRNSGLYSAVVGYNNGLYGENIATLGANNDVSGNNASVLGYNNNIDNNGVYVIGQGNTSAYSGVHMIGNDITATSHNTTIIKNDTVIITGTTVRFDASVEVGGSSAAVSGDNVSIFINDAGYITSDAYVTGISYTSGTSSGTLVLSHHSGTVTGVLSGVAHSGQNISIFVNDSDYLVSGTSNVSELVNDIGYITSDDYAVPKLTFYIWFDQANVGYRVSGAGASGELEPALYLHRGFTYDFVHSGTAHPIIIETGTGGTFTLYNSGLMNNDTSNLAGETITWKVRHDTPIVHDSGTGLWNVPSVANGAYITGRYASSTSPNAYNGLIYIV